MRALYFDGKKARPEDRAEPEGGAGLARVRVHLAGVCNTDLEIAKGYMGFQGILGHEFVGVVEDGPDGWSGERVVGEINFACGTCPSCEAGLGRHCPTRRVMGILEADGAFAEILEVPLANLHRVPDGVTDEAAVFTEPLAAAFEILEQVAVDPDGRCVVFGDGKLGLLVAQVLATTGSRVLAVGRHTEKLRLLQTAGIETCLDRDFRPEDQRADLVIEATGSAGGFEQAILATRPRGTLVLKSTVAERPAVDLAPLVIHEIHVVGSRCGPFGPALAALSSGEIQTTPLISEVLPLAKGTRALERASEPGILKVLLDCS